MADIPELEAQLDKPPSLYGRMYLQDLAAYEWYRRHAGETESRNIERRWSIDANGPPWATQEYPNEMQILKFSHDDPDTSKILEATGRGVTRMADWLKHGGT
jgi:hypothetical protein